MALIEVKHIHKHFKIAKREEGMLGAVRSLFHREYLTKRAVEDISFDIEAGEMVGYIGPNGAGKSTTIKMLTGILVPSSGEILVNGITPFKERQKNAKQIGVVFGQRTQLWWDLPTIESFELLKKIYQIPSNKYKKNMSKFIEILGMADFLNTPVRQLSLGQRMRADIAASLLHDPMLLFLDEPTIGLDVVAKEQMRIFIKEINRENGVTVILTTHDMSDIEKLCKRMILIDKGHVMYDGDLDTIKEIYNTHSTLIVDFDQKEEISIANAEVVFEEGNKKWLKFNRKEISASKLINQISQAYEIKDVEIKEPEIDDMIRLIYREGIKSSI